MNVFTKADLETILTSLQIRLSRLKREVLECKDEEDVKRSLEMLSRLTYVIVKTEFAIQDPTCHSSSTESTT